ncbi:hypothetical protein RB653_000867 [Dictyostelium firmibasis]|uniref:FAD/NAD(P)-binding domain-containing protein n=1 Tax=Dictyostelium firmibasis TaxID=79012 RepID=A0AAN7U6I4_9MYCE
MLQFRMSVSKSFKFENINLMKPNKMTSEKKRVLVIGGGYGGCEVAKQLDSKFEVTVVERKQTFFHSVGSVRAVVEPELAKKIYISYDKLLKNGKFIFGTVIEISPTLVKLEDGQELTFDYLVIATGSNVLAPFKAPLEKKTSSEILSYFQNFSQQIKQAKNILVVGGGSVACEFVSEIVQKYPVKDPELAKKITIVHSGSKLVNPKMNDKFTKVVSKAMKKRNVEVILNDRITMPDEIRNNLLNQTSPNFHVSPQTFTTEKGVSIQTDLVIWTVGVKTNSETYQSNFSNVINESGQLKVNLSCQVQGYDNIFAIGDCTDFDEFKTAYNAGYHAAVASKAIEALSKGKSGDKLAKHKVSGPLVSLSLGPQDGITQLSPTMVLEILFNIKTIKTDGEKKRVLIIGCGFGGSQVAKLLDSNFEVLVVERKQTFFHTVGSVRAVVEPELAKKIYVPYDKLLKNGKFIFGTVIEISSTLVKLEDGQELTFDYLVIATGSNALAPFKAPLEKKTGTEIFNYYENISQQIKKAKSILIVGGGTVGCEVVGEIVEKYPVNNKELAKKITIVHSSDRLVSPKTNNKFNNIVIESMKKRNVEIIFNDRIEIPEDIKQCLINQTSPNFQVSTKTYKTEKGVSIEADLVIWTVGIKLNNESYKSNFSNVINESGQLKVNLSCQVQGYDNIFAVGDITDFDELKTSYNASYHGGVVAKVIDGLSKGKSGDQLAKHKPSPPMIGLSLGPKDGVTQISSSMNLGSFLTRMLKSKGLFISKLQSHFNYPEPLKL